MAWHVEAYTQCSSRHGLGCGLSGLLQGCLNAVVCIGTANKTYYRPYVGAPLLSLPPLWQSLPGVCTIKWQTCGLLKGCIMLAANGTHWVAPVLRLRAAQYQRPCSKAVLLQCSCAVVFARLLGFFFLAGSPASLSLPLQSGCRCCSGGLLYGVPLVWQWVWNGRDPCCRQGDFSHTRYTSRSLQLCLLPKIGLQLCLLLKSGLHPSSAEVRSPRHISWVHWAPSGY
jgi:hypothetical protein